MLIKAFLKHIEITSLPSTRAKMGKLIVPNAGKNKEQLECSHLTLLDCKAVYVLDIQPAYGSVTPHLPRDS